MRTHKASCISLAAQRKSLKHQGSSQPNKAVNQNNSTMVWIHSVYRLCSVTVLRLEEQRTGECRDTSLLTVAYTPSTVPQWQSHTPNVLRVPPGHCPQGQQLTALTAWLQHQGRATFFSYLSWIQQTPDFLCFKVPAENVLCLESHLCCISICSSGALK